MNGDQSGWSVDPALYQIAELQIETLERILKRETGRELRNNPLERLHLVPFCTLTIERRGRYLEIRRGHPDIAVANFDGAFDRVAFHLFEGQNFIRSVGQNSCRNVRRTAVRRRTARIGVSRCDTPGYERRNLRRQGRSSDFSTVVHDYCLTSAPMEQISGIT
jgi:hypothetical protein